MRRVLRVVLVVGLGLASGCASASDDEAASSDAPSTTASTTTTATPDPTAEVVFSQLNDGLPIRFVAEISNPADQVRVGVTTGWTALDASGDTRINQLSREQSPIPPGESIHYVGGAPSPVPARGPAEVRLKITDPGSLTDEAPSPTASVEGAAFERAASDRFPGARDHNVAITVVALEDLAPADLYLPSYCATTQARSSAPIGQGRTRRPRASLRAKRPGSWPSSRS